MLCLLWDHTSGGGGGGACTLGGGGILNSSLKAFTEGFSLSVLTETLLFLQTSGCVGTDVDGPAFVGNNLWSLARMPCLCLGDELLGDMAS